jgi:single-strand DNA-binding protein
MSTLRNTVQLIGNVGKQPEIKSASNGNKYATFSIATTEKYTNKAGEKITDTTWHNLIVWDKQADIIERFVSKGSMLGIQGKLLNKTYADKDGTTRSRYEIQVTEIQLLGNRQVSTSVLTEEKQEVGLDNDNLPF